MADQPQAAPPPDKLTLRDFLADAGWKSRKLWLSVLCLALLCVFVGCATRWAMIAGLFPDFVGGVLGVLSIYTGGAAVGRWGNAKHVAAKLAGKQEDDGRQDGAGD